MQSKAISNSTNILLTYWGIGSVTIHGCPINQYLHIIIGRGMLVLFFQYEFHSHVWKPRFLGMINGWKDTNQINDKGGGGSLWKISWTWESILKLPSSSWCSVGTAAAGVMSLRMQIFRPTAWRYCRRSLKGGNSYSMFLVRCVGVEKIVWEIINRKKDHRLDKAANYEYEWMMSHDAL